MLEKDRGIVLAASRRGETSLYATFLGRSSGKIRLIAKGALGSRSPLRGVLERGNDVEVVYYFKPARTAYYLKEASVVRAAGDRDSLPHLSCRLAALELLDAVCHTAGADPDVVDVATEYLDVEGARDPLLFFLAFETRLLTVLGAAPAVAECAHCGAPVDEGAYVPAEGTAYCGDHAPPGPGAVRLDAALTSLLHRCQVEPLAALAAGAADPATRKRLGKLIHETYTHHVQGYDLPKSLNLI